ncbi:hypothetical protein PM082_002550 [Marasmius tenuissimus]|nr:hypothetical protein PM082_002550 [Marasmius tenuissimus]
MTTILVTVQRRSTFNLVTGFVLCAYNLIKNGTLRADIKEVGLTWRWCYKMLHPHCNSAHPLDVDNPAQRLSPNLLGFIAIFPADCEYRLALPRPQGGRREVQEEELPNAS